LLRRRRRMPRQHVLSSLGPIVRRATARVRFTPENLTPVVICLRRLPLRFAPREPELLEQPRGLRCLRIRGGRRTPGRFRPRRARLCFCRPSSCVTSLLSIRAKQQRPPHQLSLRKACSWNRRAGVGRRDQGRRRRCERLARRVPGLVADARRSHGAVSWWPASTHPAPTVRSRLSARRASGPKGSPVPRAGRPRRGQDAGTPRARRAIWVPCGYMNVCVMRSPRPQATDRISLASPYLI
jgi:hypothetical protein